jgi:hypothetical protein
MTRDSSASQMGIRERAAAVRVVARARGWRSGNSAWPRLAAPGLGVRDACAGPRCPSLEVFTPVGGCGATVVIDSVVVAELPLPSVR